MNYDRKLRLLLYIIYITSSQRYYWLLPPFTRACTILPGNQIVAIEVNPLSLESQN